MVGRVGGGEAWDTGSISAARSWKSYSCIVVGPGVGSGPPRIYGCKGNWGGASISTKGLVGNVIYLSFRVYSNWDGDRSTRTRSDVWGDDVGNYPRGSSIIGKGVINGASCARSSLI